MQRRGFIGAAAVSILGLFGIGKSREATGASFGWLREQLYRLCHVGSVRFADVHCGEGTCPMGSHSDPDKDGFRARIHGDNHTYCIVAKADYLGCTMTNRYPDPGETWLRGCDLADGKRTVETWNRIVADIERMEATGSKYPQPAVA